MKGVAMQEYSHLTLEERKELYVMKKNGGKVGKIAEKLGRDKSALYSELAKNTASLAVGYLPDEAHNQ